MDGSQKYPALRLERGGRYGRMVRVRTAKEIELDERMQRAFRRCKTPHGAYPSDAVKDIEKGKQKPWSKLALRALEMDAADVPAETIKEVCVGEFAAWLDEVLSKPKRAA